MAAEKSEGAHVNVKEQNTMARWGGDKEATHARVCACTLACVCCGTDGMQQGPWQRAWRGCEVGGVRRRPRLGLTGPQHSSARVLR
jgi:hypothetical protein